MVSQRNSLRPKTVSVLKMRTANKFMIRKATRFWSVCAVMLYRRTDSSLPIFSENGSFWTNSTTDLLAGASEEDLLGRTRNRCHDEGYESVALIPLRSGEEIIGLLQLNDRRRDCFTSEMIGYFEELGASIGIAVKRQRAEEEISRLAKFPDENPNPVLRVSGEGVVLYANQAAGPLLEVWGCQQGKSLTGQWHQLVTDVLAHGRSRQTELDCRDRVFSLTFAPIVGANYVNVYALDVTDGIRAREALRQAHGELERRVREVLHSHFRPEFLNRIDEVVVFHGLQKNHLRQIVDIQLERLRELLANREMTLELTDAAKDLLVEEGYDPAFGARPLKRTIQRLIEDPLS
ncbi:hypothetical protein LCGC14_2554080, partial [marine sediment metagenome]